MDLDLLSQMLRQHFGWKSSTNIERVASRLATNLPPEMLAKVAVDNYTPEVIEAIATVLAIHESYFFRDPALFDLLADLLREQAQPGRTITIWSAGCAKGEEAYSVAALWRQLRLPGELRVIGTDLSPAAVAAARKGEYSNWAVRGDRNRLKGVVSPVSGQLRVVPDLKRYVTFEQLNLLHSTGSLITPQSCDVVLCRNTLIYLEQEAIEQAVANLAQALTPTGYLLTAPTDPILRYAGLVSQRRGDRIVYRRASRTAMSRTSARTAPSVSRTSARTSLSALANTQESRVPQAPARAENERDHRPPASQSLEVSAAPTPRQSSEVSSPPVPPSAPVEPTVRASEPFTELLQTGIEELDQGNTTAALQLLRQALCFDLESVLALRMIALAYLAQGDLTRAQASISSALRKVGEHEQPDIPGFDGMSLKEVESDLMQVRDAIQSVSS